MLCYCHKGTLCTSYKKKCFAYKLTPPGGGGKVKMGEGREGRARGYGPISYEKCAKSHVRQCGGQNMFSTCGGLSSIPQQLCALPLLFLLLHHYKASNTKDNCLPSRMFWIMTAFKNNRPGYVVIVGTVRNVIQRNVANKVNMLAPPIIISNPTLIIWLS